MLIDMNTYYKEFHSTNHTFKVDINPFENFNIKSQFSYFLFQRHTYRYYPGTLPAKGENQGGEALREEYDNYSLSNETTVGYTFDQLDDHSLNLLAGFSAYKSGNNNFTLSGSGYMDDAVKWNNMNAVIDKETYSASSSYSSKTKMSFFGRVDYNYKSRYYITATGRFDGASNFASNHKWAFFPSCALRWNVANEEFLKDVAHPCLMPHDAAAIVAALGAPGFLVHAAHAEQLQPSCFDIIPHGVHHAAALKVKILAILTGENHHGKTCVAVDLEFHVPV
jgi:hypothetical protein